MLGFLGDPAAINQAVVGFLATSSHPSYGDLVSFLKLYSGAEREQAAQALIVAGVPASDVASALEMAAPMTTAQRLWGLGALASTIAMTYHGYKRNNSIGWAIGWGILGGLFFPITPVVALAQGFAKRKTA